MCMNPGVGSHLSLLQQVDSKYYIFFLKFDSHLGIDYLKQVKHMHSKNRCSMDDPITYCYDVNIHVPASFHWVAGQICAVGPQLRVGYLVCPPWQQGLPVP